MKIRSKLLLVMLPLLTATAVITAVVSSTSARVGMTRLAVRFSNYKAEQLSGYMRSQWDLLLDNGFATNEAFLDAARGNVAAFSMGLIRRPEDLILAVDASGELAMQTGDVALNPWELDELFVDGGGGEDGWVDVEVGGKRFVGHTFYFVPFQWQTFVLEEHRAFFAEIRQISLRSLFVLLGVLVAGTILTMVFSNYLTGPIQRVVAAMEVVGKDVNSGAEVPVEYPDEIGELAHQFNNMTDDLVATYGRLKSFAFAEALARKHIIDSERETLEVMARAAEFRDPESAAHVVRVGEYARLIAVGLDLDSYRQALLNYASPLHDVGKLGVSESILLKPGPLTDEEWRVMLKHPQMGYDVLKNSKSPYLKAGADIALTHHERFDGTGYPQGLRGREIPLFGRIVGLVDVFDALTTKRPYKEIWPLEKAVAHLEEEKNRHFDEKLVDVFLSQLTDVKRIQTENPG